MAPTLELPDVAVVSARFLDVRARTEQLAEPLSPEDQTVQSMPDASPTKWHRAHTTWFFETFVLNQQVPGYHPFHPTFGYLFNSYYEQIGARHPRPDRGLVTRPGAAEVGAYRRAIDDGVLAFLAGSSSSDVSCAMPLVELGCHHEQQHQELVLMDIKHALSRSVMEPAYLPRPHQRCADPGRLGWVDVAGGIAEIGHAGDGFAFDNEGPRHDVLRPAPSVNTTASSWRTSTSCGADAQSRRPATSGRPIATSSTCTPAGTSPGCGLPRTWTEMEVSGVIKVENHLPADWAADTMREEVARALTSRPKILAPRWLYDDRGSSLFTEITRLAEYYPTEAERSILRAHADDIVAATGADTLVELGSGTSDKTQTLLDAFCGRRRAPALCTGRREPGNPRRRGVSVGGALPRSRGSRRRRRLHSAPPVRARRCTSGRRVPRRHDRQPLRRRASSVSRCAGRSPPPW